MSLVHLMPETMPEAYLEAVNQFIGDCLVRDNVNLESALSMKGSKTREERMATWWDFIRKQLTQVRWSDPDIRIGPEGDDYLHRWHLIPRNPVFNIYLHRFLRSDDDRALHDHPWRSLSVMLRGMAIEHTPADARVYKPGDIIYRPCPWPHRIELPGEEVWTLFLTGPVVREWGFLCRQGWRPWHEYVGGRDNFGGRRSDMPACD